MDLPGIRIWIIFYVVAILILIGAISISVKGVMVFVCLILVCIAIGISFFTVNTQLKIQAARTEMQRQLVEGFIRGPPEEGLKKR
ncbi:MAG: hypothetical protein WC295_02660 [Methanoregula sp.]|jgi:glucan phosphoethanolaminetransferase (alkaline phosphatase superfamily)